jgi:uncharacterized protein DUF3667
MTGDAEAILETAAAAAAELTLSHAAKGGAAHDAACANCTHPLDGAAFCPVCGQPTKTRRRAVHHLVQDLAEEILGFESRTLRTARALLTQPGELPSAFREHRTQPYVPAVRLYLFVSLIFFVLLGLDHIAIMQIEVTATPVKVIRDGKGNYFIPNPANARVSKAMSMELKADDDPDIKKYVQPLIPITKEKAQLGMFNYSTQMHYFAPIGAYHAKLSDAARKRLMLDKVTDSKDPDAQKSAAWIKNTINTFVARIAADPAALNEPLTTWIPRALFLLLPLYGFLVALFHIRRRKDYYIVDHMVFSLSVHTFAFVVLTVAVLLGQLIPGEFVAWLVLGAITVYTFVAMKQFYRQGWFLTTVKFVCISGIYFSFFLMPALAGVLVLSAIGG